MRCVAIPDADTVGEESLAAERAPKTFCPSEAARLLSADWRLLMPDVRRVAATLPLIATQKGQPVDPLTAKGPIRLQET